MRANLHRRVRARSGRVLVALAVALALALGWAVVADGMDEPGRCVATGPGSRVSVTPEQAGNAATIAAVAIRRGLPEHAAVVAIATALQESKLRNLAHGDRDSLGLFQQRPSQGWGTPRQIRDPVYAAERFYDGLTGVPRYESLPLTVAAQRVQRSATPNAYARHEDEAQVLAAALTGVRPAALTCAVHGSARAGEAPGATGLTPRAETVLRELVRGFGGLSLTHGGRTVDVRQPTTPAEAQTGWAVAQWAVARAGALAITEVSYDGSIWTADRSADGWRPVRSRTDGVHITVG